MRLQGPCAISSARRGLLPPTSSCNCSAYRPSRSWRHCVFWGWRLIAARRLERVKARLVLWLAGGFFAAGLASLLPVTTRWPLPTGLGGVAGDAILAIPNRLLAGHGAAMLIFAALLAGGAILCLSASISLRNYTGDDLGEDGDDPLPERPAAPAPEERDAAGEPGAALILLGALFHAGLSLKAAVARQIARRRAIATGRMARRATRA